MVAPVWDFKTLAPSSQRQTTYVRREQGVLRIAVDAHPQRTQPRRARGDRAARRADGDVRLPRGRAARRPVMAVARRHAVGLQASVGAGVAEQRRRPAVLDDQVAARRQRGLARCGGQ